MVIWSKMAERRPQKKWIEKDLASQGRSSHAEYPLLEGKSALSSCEIQDVEGHGKG